MRKLRITQDEAKKMLERRIDWWEQKRKRLDVQLREASWDACGWEDEVGELHDLERQMLTAQSHKAALTHALFIVDHIVPEEADDASKSVATTTKEDGEVESFKILTISPELQALLEEADAKAAKEGK